MTLKEIQAIEEAYQCMEYQKDEKNKDLVEDEERNK